MLKASKEIWYAIGYNTSLGTTWRSLALGSAYAI